MEQITNGIFSEQNSLWPGQFFSLEIDKVLHQEKSTFQDILVLKTKCHGTALVLDGIIQCTENDEFAYQEMIAFLPLCAHENPTNVLIIGGGDGGVAREVSKHPRVAHIVQVEIDAKVVEISKRYLPFMAEGFQSPKLTLNIGDGFEYMRKHKEEFDVIITDSSDPIGAAANLFTEEYFELMKNALRPNGIICSQGGTIWSQLEHIRGTINNCKKHFNVVKYATNSVPTYPTGQMGYIIGAVAKNTDLTIPKYIFSEQQIKELKLRFYNSEVHTASFVLPNFVKKNLL